HLDAHALGADEAVAVGGVGLEGAADAPAGRLDGLADDPLELLLEGPGGDVRALAQVAGGDQIGGPLRGGELLADGRELVGRGHGGLPGGGADQDRAGPAGPAGLCGPGPSPRWISIASKVGAGGLTVLGRSR